MTGWRLGTCSWNYPSWEGLVYPSNDKAEFLPTYAARFNTVEVDRWFWSLFEDPMKVRLPLKRDAQTYRDAVSSTFRFAVKAPNSLTLTHLYKKNRHDKAEPLVDNPHFLSSDLMLEFLDRLQPLHDVLGPVMFQFEYLNKQKMPSAKLFREAFGRFAESLPASFTFALEIRNKNYLTTEHFEFMLSHNLIPVLISGYWMPRISELFAAHRQLLHQFPLIIFRLMGEDRSAIEKETGKQWNKIVKPHDAELDEISRLMLALRSADVTPFVFVNNHYEGSAPITIDRLMERLTA